MTARPETAQATAATKNGNESLLVWNGNVAHVLPTNAGTSAEPELDEQTRSPENARVSAWHGTRSPKRGRLPDR